MSDTLSTVLDWTLASVVLFVFMFSGFTVGYMFNPNTIVPNITAAIGAAGALMLWMFDMV